MDNTKEEKSASDVLSGFFAKTQKFWIVFLILLVVVSVAVGVLVTVKNNANQKGANFLDAAVFSYFKSKSTLEGDELVAAEDKFLSDVKAFAETNGKNDNTVRANMMVAANAIHRSSRYIFNIFKTFFIICYFVVSNYIIYE